MESVKYNVVQEELCCEESAYIGYGVSYVDDFSVKDVSTDRIYVEKLVKLLNECDLAPEHLQDVLEDFIL
ncbi:MAG: DUF6514 family protein [Clostridia bacterium]|nr:DUF6514 family protein [Clostridia bacterium]